MKMTKSKIEIEGDILQAMPRSLQVFYKLVKEAEREMKQESRAKNETPRKKKKKKRGGV